MAELDLLFILKNNAAYLLDRGFPKASQACTDAVTEIERLRAALSNLSNAAAIVYAAFKPISGPDETAKALLKMELGLKD